MLGVCFSLIGSIMSYSYGSIIIMLGALVPFSMMYMYKTSTYQEDAFFCSNDMNGALIFMSVTLVLLIYLASWSILHEKYFLLHLTLLFILVVCFSANNFMLFYVFFEGSLLPILLMIVGWGYQPERLQATMYMIMYTVLGSMPLFSLIMFMYYSHNTLNWYSLSMFLNGGIWYIIGMVAFLVKLPMWSVHVWLPKAHVEAPLGGSMVLAGALLKLGGYGMYMYNGLVVWTMSSTILIIVVSLAMWGGMISSVLCLCQSDIKSMIAYSSIVHMALVVMGCLSCTSWGMFSSLIMMISHGFSSSAMFLLAYVTYEKINSRAFFLTKGMLTLYPVLGLFWFLVLLTNMAVPPTINFVGELQSLPVSLWFGASIFFVLVSTLFLSVSYNMNLYTQINHGPSNMYMYYGGNISSVSMLALTGHLLPLLLLFRLNIFCN